jgi:dihydroxyacid dehydratase/phosphogluconate dehydratase
VLDHAYARVESKRRQRGPVQSRPVGRSLCTYDSLASKAHENALGAVSLEGTSTNNIIHLNAAS